VYVKDIQRGSALPQMSDGVATQRLYIPLHDEAQRQLTEMSNMECTASFLSATHRTDYNVVPRSFPSLVCFLLVYDY